MINFSQDEVLINSEKIIGIYVRDDGFIQIDCSDDPDGYYLEKYSYREVAKAVELSLSKKYIII